MKKSVAILLAWLAAMAFSAANAQSRIREECPIGIPADSADVAYYGRRDFKQAALTVAGLNVGVWAFDRYVQNADFCKISWNSIKENFKHGFIWDNDRLGTNMFLHPYHGNLYYNSARSNGFNYWQSGVFAFAGSAMWELFMESEYPSTNDIIATPIGGMAIGEFFFRTSDLLVDDRSTGWERAGREAGIFLLSPMRSLTRIINGDAWRRRSTPGRVFGLPHIDYEISLGIRGIEFKNQTLDKGAGMCLELNMEYGDRFEPSSTSPYDYFTLRLNLNAQASQPVLGQLNIMGRLISREILEKYDDYVSIGLYQHYDYYDSDTISAKSHKTPYKLAIPASVGFGVLYKYKHGDAWTIDAHVHPSAILLGGMLSDHYNLGDRNYNLGSGFSVKSGANFVYGKDKFSVSANYDYYRLYTWGYPRGTDMASVNLRTLNAEGDDSNAYFGVVDTRIDYKIAKRLWLTAGFTHYMRSTAYRDFPNVQSSSYSFRLMLTYKLF